MEDPEIDGHLCRLSFRDHHLLNSVPRPFHVRKMYLVLYKSGYRVGYTLLPGHLANGTCLSGDVVTQGIQHSSLSICPFSECSVQSVHLKTDPRKEERFVDPSFFSLSVASCFETRKCFDTIYSTFQGLHSVFHCHFKSLPLLSSFHEKRHVIRLLFVSSTLIHCHLLLLPIAIVYVWAKTSTQDLSMDEV